jgi:hypothetical protein
MLLNNTLKEPIISPTLYCTRFITKFCPISHYKMCSSPHPPIFKKKSVNNIWPIVKNMQADAIFHSSVHEDSDF